MVKNIDKIRLNATVLPSKQDPTGCGWLTLVSSYTLNVLNPNPPVVVVREREREKEVFIYFIVMPRSGTERSGAKTVNPALLAFRPRQVLLAAQLMKQSKPNAVSLDSHQKALLLRSVARFLKANGFSKTLKKFLSEAHVEVSTLLTQLDLLCFLCPLQIQIVNRKKKALCENVSSAISFKGIVCSGQCVFFFFF